MKRTSRVPSFLREDEEEEGVIEGIEEEDGEMVEEVEEEEEEKEEEAEMGGVVGVLMYRKTVPCCSVVLPKS